jgi:AmmeMemoRadiSam system protein A
MPRFFLLIISVVMLITPGSSVLAEEVLNKSEQQTLIRIARDTLRLYLARQLVPALSDYPASAALQRQCGVFVTLKNRNSGDLRGCIGHMYGEKPLREAVRDCTIESATRDRRFSPLQAGEEQTVLIEISVLTPPQKIATINEIQIGTHGLIITRGMHRGVLLPQVPLEWGWSRDDFLKAICEKAGLPQGAWKEGAELFIFTAQVFKEQER